MQTVQFERHCNLKTAARELIKAAKIDGAAEGVFRNNIILKADKNSTVKGIVAYFSHQMKCLVEMWRESPQKLLKPVTKVKIGDGPESFTLQVYELLEEAPDEAIIEVLGGKDIAALTEEQALNAAKVLRHQSKTDKGPLLSNGMPNAFYVIFSDGRALPYTIYWADDPETKYDGWDAFALPTMDGWNPGSQILAPSSKCSA